MSLAERVLRTIRRHGLVPREGRVIVALSGGPDSVALVHLMRELADRGELSVAGVAHFNHQLRGEDAEQDERFCRRLADTLSLPIEVGSEDIRARAGRERRSIEDAGRSARYAFLDRAASRLGADAVATGHTRDDQAETFLLRLIRGAGPRGLAGIYPRSGRVVRPVLDVRRAELRAYAEVRRLEFREDATNRDVSIPRNRIRHELIPYLERAFSPAIVDVLAREAAIAREDEDRLHAETIALLAGDVLTDTGTGAATARLDAAQLAALHPALASRVVREVLGRLAPGRFAGFEHVDRLLELVRGGAGGSALSLPGLEAVRRGGRVEVAPKGPAAFSNFFQVPLPIPGEVVLSGRGWAVSASWGTPCTRGQTPVQTAAGVRPRTLEAAVRGDAVRLPLTLRSRKPGDRIRPAGMGGRSKKLQDLLVDRKIGRAARDRLPLVVDADDRIVWVVGEPPGEDFRVSGPSQGVILLKARHLGGPG